jgi:hypothetical protein
VKDILLLSVTVFAFALLVTVHCTIVFGLFRLSPRWRALAALFVVPLAPYWALRERMGVRAWIWLVSALFYAAAMIVQRF